MAPQRTMEEELKSNPQLCLQDVKSLRAWANKQPHLPNIDDIPDLYLSFFLRRRYYDLEKAKKTFEHFLTFRTNEPEMSINRTLPDIQRFFDTNYIIPLKDRDSEGNIVMFSSFFDPDPSKYDVNLAFRGGIAVLDSWLLENGSAAGETVIYDQELMSLKHAARISLSSIRNIVYYNKDCSHTSMKRIFLINANSFLQKILTLLKPALSSSFSKRLQIFTRSQMDEFYKIVPRECMPNEYGGTAGSLQDLNKKSLELVERHADFFRKLDSLKVDESKRPGKNNKVLLSFKKMDLD